MKRILTILVSWVFVFFSARFNAQKISWGQINSNNIIDVIIKQTVITESISSLQIGNYNNAELFLNNRTAILLQQIGDFNKVYFNNSFTETAAKTSITTQGYNNIIDITGSNSISEKLKLNVKGDNMTIFMRNY